MTRKHLIALATATAVLAMAGATLAGTASAATKDYASPDGTCYSSGWCHWNEVCYDAFGGCYFDFWCPQGATSPGQCSYYGGFQPYATAVSSASGPGVTTSTSTSSASSAGGGSGSTTSSTTSVITSTATIDDSTNGGGTVTLNPDTGCDGLSFTSTCYSVGTGNYSRSATSNAMNGGVMGYSDYGNFNMWGGWWR